ncbi:MAG: thioredoxin [Candidatus Marinimicrobia bacterium]|nr:thioredoxin [Candidatus Neomarinimicrobiota bacterium]
MAKEFTDENFEQEVLGSEVPVLVDFWGEGCGPCVAMTPVLEELAAEYKEKVKIGKVDVYANPSISSRYGIRSIPSFLFFKDGEVQETIIGARPISFMKDKLDSVI